MFLNTVISFSPKFLYYFKNIVFKKKSKLRKDKLLSIKNRKSLNILILNRLKLLYMQIIG